MQVDIVAKLIELKPGSTDRVADWTKYVQENRAAAEETLRNEGVSVESWFALSLEGKDYLLCYMRASSMEKAAAVAGSSHNSIDVYHRQFKADTWVRGAGVAARLLVDLRGQLDREAVTLV